MPPSRPVHGDDSYLYPHALDFSSNINPLGPGERVKGALKNALPRISHYPSEGEGLKEALGEFTGLEKENIALGNGSSELIKDFCFAFLNPGDRVLIGSPTFAEYGYFSRLRGAKVDFFELPREQEVGPPEPGDYRAIFLCHPNNPTSHHYRNLEELLEGEALVFMDEAYVEFSPLESQEGLVESYPNLFILRSLTKFYSLAGLRLGYALSSLGNVSAIEKIQPPWNVNSLAMEAGKAALGDEGYRKKSRELILGEREFLKRGFSSIGGVEFLPSYSNFFLLNLSFPSKEAKTRLLEKGILVRDCSSFGLEKSIRVCIREREDNVKLLEALEEVCSTNP